MSHHTVQLAVSNEWTMDIIEDVLGTEYRSLT